MYLVKTFCINCAPIKAIFTFHSPFYFILFILISNTWEKYKQIFRPFDKLEPHCKFSFSLDNILNWETFLDQYYSLHKIISTVVYLQLVTLVIAYIFISWGINYFRQTLHLFIDKNYTENSFVILTSNDILIQLTTRNIASQKFWQE